MPRKRKSQQLRLVESYDSSTEGIGDKRDTKKRGANSPDKSETTHGAASARDNSSAAGHQATKAAVRWKLQNFIDRLRPCKW